MIRLENINFKYQDNELYNNINIRLLVNEHSVLVGPNGSGKTTLMKLIAKELTPDKGDVLYAPNIKVGYLDQYMEIESNLIVSKYLYDVFNDLFLKEEEMNNYYNKISENNLTDYEIDNYLNYASDIGEFLLDNDFYQIKSKISSVIHGLGLSKEVLDKEFKYLSSGMKAKVILAKLLLEENDIILLDEPTNFLDKEHITFLTRFLKEYENAFLVISHDEQFLSEIAETVFSLDNKLVERYRGNYNFYLNERVIREEHYEKEYLKQQRYIKETKTFIEKNIVRSSTSARAKSRRKMLSKINILEKLNKDITYTFSFPVKLQTGRDVLEVKDLEIGYNNNSLVEPLNFIVRKEDKVVITGENGVGKSTLINTITNNLNKISGDFKWDKNTKISYLKQDDFYTLETTAFNEVSNYYPNFNNTEIMNLLASYNITYEMAKRPIHTLSGGEQTKIKLALLKENYGNVLILDEPTNHLDIQAKEALKDALINYTGTLILVSHDKDFYETICDYEISLF